MHQYSEMEPGNVNMRSFNVLTCGSVTQFYMTA